MANSPRFDVNYCHIYSLSDPITNEVRYIGKTNNLSKRLIGHLYDSKSFNHYTARWIRSLKEKGFKPKIESIDYVGVEEWEFWEIHYISLFKSWGFRLTNGTDGGDGRSPGFIVSEETRKKLSHTAWNKGISCSEETKLKLSIALKGSKGYWKGTKGLKPANKGSFQKGHKRREKILSVETLADIKKESNEGMSNWAIKKKYKISYKRISQIIKIN